MVNILNRLQRKLSGYDKNKFNNNLDILFDDLNPEELYIDGVPEKIKKAKSYVKKNIKFILEDSPTLSDLDANLLKKAVKTLDSGIDFFSDADKYAILKNKKGELTGNVFEEQLSAIDEVGKLALDVIDSLKGIKDFPLVIRNKLKE